MPESVAYEIFEHKGVEYKLFSGIHNASSDAMIKNSGGLKDLDILILENGEIDLESFIYHAVHHVQYKEIFEKIPRENPSIKIYAVDFPLNKFGLYSSMLVEGVWAYFGTRWTLQAFGRKKISRRKMLKRMGKLGAGFICLSMLGSFLNSKRDKEDIELLSEANSIHSSVIPTPVLGFRDAVIARIIDEYIVPREKSEIKPLKIGILYGAAHSGIEHKICSKALRDATIKPYELAGYPTTLKDGLNKIARFTYDHGMYFREDIQLNQF